MLSRAEAHRALVWNTLSGRQTRWGSPWGPEGGATGAYRLATGDSRARLKASFSFHSLLASVCTQLGLVLRSMAQNHAPSSQVCMSSARVACDQPDATQSEKRIHICTRCVYCEHIHVDTSVCEQALAINGNNKLIPYGRNT